MMRICTILILSLGIGQALWAQQEERYTQFMHYKLGINPAYAGSSGGISFAGLVRSQWIGLDGAPETQLVSFSMPAWGQRVGLGGNILRQTIGVTSNYSLEAVYSYRIQAPRGYINAGLQTSVRMIRTDFTRLRGTQPIEIDPSVPGTLQSRLVPNFGAGLYYYTDNFYMGFSVPRLVQNNIDLSDDGGTLSREVRHAYFMTGFLVRLSENVSIQPQTLFTYVKSAPFSADFNLSFIFFDKFISGVSYRPGGSKESGFGESLSFLFSTQIGAKMLFGLSYDATLSDLKRYNSGTIEGVFRFFFAGKAGSTRGLQVDDPRNLIF